MTDHAVIIAGAGPTGLMLAAELRLAGVEALVVEKRVERQRLQPGALGLHARTIEIFDQRGIADRFLAEGKPMQVVGFAGVRLDISTFPTRHPYGLSLVQKHSERILSDWADELGVTVLRGAEIVRFEQGGEGVEVGLDDGRRLRAHYLVGCDGGRSFVRKHAGIGFPGSDPTVSHLLAEAELEGEPSLGLFQDAVGTYALSKAENGKFGIMVTESEIGKGAVTIDTLRTALTVHHGTDLGVRNPTYITRFTDMTRQAETYRKGRVLLAGDAAHIHYPAGGFGMGIGLQDAVNLGWKLALVAKGLAPDSLLDTYNTERHPVAERLLRYTLASVALARSDTRTKAVAAIMGELLAMAEPGRTIAAEMSGLGTHYDMGAGHPLLGRRMPDIDLTTASGSGRLFDRMHHARPILLNLRPGTALDAGPWRARLDMVTGRYEGIWDLPGIGAVEAPAAVQIRPDGHVAWVGVGSDAGLRAALAHWYGPA